MWSQRPVAREALLCAGLATAAASLLVWLGPPGTDFAAHVYQRALFLRHGFTLWDDFWYAGRYSFVGYSILYYPLAALLGMRVLAVATVSVITFAIRSGRATRPAVPVAPRCTTPSWRRTLWPTASDTTS